MIYRRMYRMVAWIFLGIGAAFAAAAIIVASVNRLTLTDLFAARTDAEIVGLVMSMLAAVLVIPAVIFGVLSRVYASRIEYLRSDGMKVEAVIDGVSPLYYMSSGYGQSYLITCRWEHEGRAYMYRSEYLNYNPERYLADHNIKTIPVYVDRYNPRLYYVDISILKNVVVA